MIIKNKDDLLSHGNVAGREAVLKILEAGLAAGDPYDNVRSMLRLEGNRLIVGSDRFPPAHIGWSVPYSQERPLPGEPLVFDLDKVGNIYVVGGGKAAQRMAKAIEDVLGDRITEGHVNAKKGDEIYLEHIEVTLAGHPIPDEDSAIGAARILEIERKAKKGDLVLLSESGGGTALMALPAPGITLEDIQEVNRLLYFGCGASMPEANAVRNMLGILRARHSRYVGEATMLHIATPEQPPGLRVHLHDRPRDVDAYEYAIHILKVNGCWESVPESVRKYLQAADPAYTPMHPKEWHAQPHYHFRVMGPEYMLEAAERKARELGLRATVLVSSLTDIEAQAAGETCAYIAQEIDVHERPLRSPCVFLCGGELVVTVGQCNGHGGRNQEFVLAAAPRIADSPRIVIGSADSDGCDGPTDVAGAIVDGQTFRRAREAGLDLFGELRNHNSHAVLEALGDTIYTGVQKTNIQDLRVVYVGAAS